MRMKRTAAKKASDMTAKELLDERIDALRAIKPSDEVDPIALAVEIRHLVEIRCQIESENNVPLTRVD